MCCILPNEISLLYNGCFVVPETMLGERFEIFMMTSSNGNIFRVTGPLCHRSPVDSPHKGSDAEVRCFLWSAPDWVNNRNAVDLRRHRTLWRHCNVLWETCTFAWYNVTQCIYHMFKMLHVSWKSNHVHIYIHSWIYRNKLLCVHAIKRHNLLKAFLWNQENDFHFF